MFARYGIPLECVEFVCCHSTRSGKTKQNNEKGSVIETKAQEELKWELEKYWEKDLQVSAGICGEIAETQPSVQQEMGSQ